MPSPSLDLHKIFIESNLTIFIDLSQAFDTVNRNVIYNSLIKHNVPDKLMKLIKLILQRTKTKVKVNNNYSEWFETKTGVRQGDPLSALLFSVVLDSVITNLEVRGNITSRLKQICAYVDDIILIGSTTKKLRGLSPQANYTDRAAAAGRRS